MEAFPGRGRRDNGLPSASWGALVDVDPRLSEALLSRLGSAGVGAYVEPAAGADAFTRATTLPARPLDRLWVDADQADRAREVVAAEVAELTALIAEQEPGATAHGLVHPVPRSADRRVLTPPPLPGPGAPPAATPPAATPSGATPAPDPDEEFRRIVEGFGRESDSPVPPWPVSEDVKPGSRPPAGPGDAEGGSPRRRRRTDAGAGAGDDGLPGWVEPEALEDEGHYEPPPPPPLPRLAPRRVAAVGALVVGVLLMFAPQLLLQDRTTFVLGCGLLITLAGGAAVLYLMRDAPGDDGPDDGAVV